MNSFVYIGYIAGIFTSLAFIPQVVKVIKDKNTEGLSLSMYLMFVIGVSLWVTYGFFVHDIPVLITNLVTLAFSFPVLSMIIKDRRSVKNFTEK